MVNLKPQVCKKLQEISDIEVSYFYPKELIKGKKLISYYELDNSEATTVDNEEYSSNITMQVDVWCDTPEECSELAIKVNNKMKDIGFHRIKCLDLYEEGAIKHQKTMCFKKEEIL